MSDRAIDRKKIKDLIHTLGLKYGLSDEIIKKIIESPYEFAHSKISELDIEGIESEEEFEKFKTNFNFKALGKLYMSYSLLKRRNKQKENIINLNKKQEPNG